MLSVYFDFKLKMVIFHRNTMSNINPSDNIVEDRSLRICEVEKPDDAGKTNSSLSAQV